MNSREKRITLLLFFSTRTLCELSLEKCFFFFLTRSTFPLVSYSYLTVVDYQIWICLNSHYRFTNARGKASLRLEDEVARVILFYEDLACYSVASGNNPWKHRERETKRAKAANTPDETCVIAKHAFSFALALRAILSRGSPVIRLRGLQLRKLPGIFIPLLWFKLHISAIFSHRCQEVGGGTIESAVDFMLLFLWLYVW